MTGVNIFNQFSFKGEYLCAGTDIYNENNFRIRIYENIYKIFYIYENIYKIYENNLELVRIKLIYKYLYIQVFIYYYFSLFTPFYIFGFLFSWMLLYFAFYSINYLYLEQELLR